MLFCYSEKPLFYLSKTLVFTRVQTRPKCNRVDFGLQKHQISSKMAAQRAPKIAQKCILLKDILTQKTATHGNAFFNDLRPSGGPKSSHFT